MKTYLKLAIAIIEKVQQWFEVKRSSLSFTSNCSKTYNLLLNLLLHIYIKVQQKQFLIHLGKKLAIAWAKILDLSLPSNCLF